MSTVMHCSNASTSTTFTSWFQQSHCHLPLSLPIKSAILLENSSHMVNNSCKEVFASLIGSESEKSPLVWAACSFGTLASSIFGFQSNKGYIRLDLVYEFMIRLRDNRHNSLNTRILKIGIVSSQRWVNGIYYYLMRRINQSWEAVLVEGSAEICMCWEVSLLKEKGFCHIHISCWLH